MWTSIICPFDRPSHERGFALRGKDAYSLGLGLKEGDVAPDFEATDTDGNTFKLSELLEAGPVVLTFYPKAFTPL